MLYFGTCNGYPDKLTKHARPGLTASMHESYVHLTPASNGVDIFPVYAGIMREALAAEAECLVLMHDDLEFRDPELASKLRKAFEDPSVAIVGLIGARNVRNLRWWQGDRAGRVEDSGYGVHDFGFDRCEVDSIDGMMVALSPWAMANLTLDGLGYRGFHGYDAELSFQARAKGKRVVVADITAFHHSKGGFTQGLEDAEVVFQRRWSAARQSGGPVMPSPSCVKCGEASCPVVPCWRTTTFTPARATATCTGCSAIFGQLHCDIVRGGLPFCEKCSEHCADSVQLAEMIRRVQEAGTDSLSHFGGGYTHEGGLYLQQNPEEFAGLALLLQSRGTGARYLEIGTASGGAARFLHDLCGFKSVSCLDDGKHPRAVYQGKLLPPHAERWLGDSHSDDARIALEAPPAPDVAFIDGDHSYEGVTADIAMVLPRCQAGALIILHDTVVCDGVKRAWRELLASGKARKVAEFIGAERPLGIGVAEVVAVQVAAAPIEERIEDVNRMLDGAYDIRPPVLVHRDINPPDSDPWALLRTPGPWTAEQLGAMYDAHRGEPVSATPCVHMIVPSYREGHDIAKLTEKSRGAIIDDLMAHGIDGMRSDIDGDSLVQRMRQRAMHMFLKGTATHLLWTDLDIEALDHTCVRKMIRSGYDIVGGACPFKNMERRVVCNFLPTMAAQLDVPSLNLPHGCLEVHDVGTGFQVVSRKAILQMMAAHPELLHWSRSSSDLGEPLWALYDTGVVDGCYESEDFMMCRYWQQLGGKVYVYVPATFRHYGTYGFEASLMEQLGWEAAK